MPLPALWSLVPVFCTYTRLDGTPATGVVRFVAPFPVAIEGELIVPKAIEVRLDVDGAIEVDLPTTNDPDLSARGWAYTVEEMVDKRLIREPWRLQVPYEGEAIDLSTATPSPPSDPVDGSAAVGPAGRGVPPGGTIGQILAKASNADYDDAWVDPQDAGDGVTTAELNAALLTKADAAATAAALATKADGAATTAALAGKAAIDDGITGDERAKLAGIAAGATANASNAELRDRATHTGQQAAATISDFAAAVAASAAVVDLAARMPVVAVTEYPVPEVAGVLYVLFEAP